MKNKIETLEELKNIFENKFNYFPTTDILTETFLALDNFEIKETYGQEIYALSLDGPAGAGKSSFVSTYKKVLEYLLGEKVEFINFECNATVGSSELIEEVGMIAVVIKDEEKIIIPGAITKAIKKVNEGKKVILLIDEFDKSRPETDVFFYKFLQSGEVNTVQQGDLKIKEDYKNNLQVFFCKNDFRELSAPLSRRTRSLILDYMKPSLFYKIATDEFKNNKSIIPILNLVTLIYEFAYINKENFNRLPSASELLISIADAYRMTAKLNIEGKDIYRLIFKRLFKSVDDYQIMESLLQNNNDEKYNKLKELLNELKISEENITESSLNEMLLKSVLNDIIDEKTKELIKKQEEYDELIKKSREELEEQKTLLLNERMKLRSKDNNDNTIKLNGGNLISSDLKDHIINNFDNPVEFIKRGKSIFTSIDNANWTEICNIEIKGKTHKELIDKLIKISSQIGFTIYEDGILLNDSIIGLIMTANSNESNNLTYKFYSSSQILPSNYLLVLESILTIIKKIFNTDFKININTLIYNDKNLNLPSESSNVYIFTTNNFDFETFNKTLNSMKLQCKDKTKVISKALELIDSKKLSL